jgi:hypothetical protein
VNHFHPTAGLSELNPRGTPIAAGVGGVAGTSGAAGVAVSSAERSLASFREVAASKLGRQG